MTESRRKRVNNPEEVELDSDTSHYEFIEQIFVTVGSFGSAVLTAVATLFKGNVEVTQALTATSCAFIFICGFFKM